MTRSIRFRSELESSAEAVWAAAGTIQGVNYELAPWLRMTAPRWAAGFRIEQAPVGEPVFVSWILLGGALPIDRHALRFARIDAGRGFDEDSTSWTERRWRHSRRVEPLGAARCAVSDEVSFEPRLLGGLVQAVIQRIFAHRHRRLRRKYGGDFGA